MASMVTLILHDMSQFADVLAAWHDAGAPAVTVLEALGTRDISEQARRDDLPLFPSVRDVLEADDVPRTTIFSVVPDELVDPLIETTERVVGGLAEPGNGVLFVIPVSRVVGLDLSGESAAPA